MFKLFLSKNHAPNTYHNSLFFNQLKTYRAIINAAGTAYILQLNGMIALVHFKLPLLICLLS
jgi:hypothetical protein